MSRRTRGTHSPSSEAKVALAAVRSDSTLAELAVCAFFIPFLYHLYTFFTPFLLICCDLAAFRNNLCPHAYP